MAAFEHPSASTDGPALPSTETGDEVSNGGFQPGAFSEAAVTIGVVVRTRSSGGYAERLASSWPAEPAEHRSGSYI